MWMPRVKDIEHIVKQPEKLLVTHDDATVAEAAKIMSDHQVGALIVLGEDNRLAGIVSERDMLREVLAKAKSANDILVKDIMTDRPVYCTLENTMAQVEQLMAKHKIRHLPIVQNGKPVGIISSRDVMAHRLGNNKMMKIAAEQMALLSTGLKSLDFDDVVELAINEVPKSFQADCAVLYLDQKDGTALVYANGCPLTKEKLQDLARDGAVSKDNQIIYDQVCTHCKKAGRRSPNLIIPLTVHDQCAGFGGSDKPTRGFLCICGMKEASDGARERRLYKASLLREVLSVNLTNARLYQNYQRARRDSETDPLTSVGTRRVLDQLLKIEFSRAVRYHKAFSVAIIDLDNFKQINDSAGHAAGDNALRQLAKAMVETCRKSDVIVRYGGDEFILLMPETDLHDAAVLLERLRRKVRTISVPKVKRITISCGVAELLWGGPSDTPEEIIKRADAALYEAKRAGRNRVVTSKQTANAAP